MGTNKAHVRLAGCRLQLRGRPRPVVTPKLDSLAKRRRGLARLDASPLRGFNGYSVPKTHCTPRDGLPSHVCEDKVKTVIDPRRTIS